MSQTKLGEIRVRVPYYSLKKWKDYPLAYYDGIEKLESVRDELEEALEKIEKQLEEVRR